MRSLDGLFGRLGNRMFQLAYVYAQVQRGELPNIWLQDPKYFDGQRASIMSLFGDDIQPRDEVSVHVRRGDYLHKDTFFVNLAETDYYEQAMARFPGEKFLIFSDDPSWCQTRWPSIPVSAEKDEISALNAMAGCKSNIIANSTFSWWAAYLNPNPNKTVIYPKVWHTHHVIDVGFPAEWIGL